LLSCFCEVTPMRAVGAHIHRGGNALAEREYFDGSEASLQDGSKDRSHLETFLVRLPYYVPVFKWLPEYNWTLFRYDLVCHAPHLRAFSMFCRHGPPLLGTGWCVLSALLSACTLVQFSGITVATMIIPTGLAYADLAQVCIRNGRIVLECGGALLLRVKGLLVSHGRSR
jgi:hypothetical protein